MVCGEWNQGYRVRIPKALSCARGTEKEFLVLAQSCFQESTEEEKGREHQAMRQEERQPEFSP